MERDSLMRWGAEDARVHEEEGWNPLSTGKAKPRSTEAPSSAPVMTTERGIPRPPPKAHGALPTATTRMRRGTPVTGKAWARPDARTAWTDNAAQRRRRRIILGRDELPKRGRRSQGSRSRKDKSRLPPGQMLMTRRRRTTIGLTPTSRSGTKSTSPPSQ